MLVVTVVLPVAAVSQQTPQVTPETTAVAGAALSSVGAASVAAIADRYLGHDREMSFAAYLDFIKSVQVISRDGMGRIGVPWEKALENGHRRFLEARSVNDVYYALLSVQRTLRDGHGRFESKELPVSFGKAVYLDLEVVVNYRQASGGPYDYDVATSHEAALPAGSTILNFAGMPVAAFEAEMLEWYDRHTPEGFRAFVARRFSFCEPKAMPCPSPGDEVEVTYLDRDGAQHVGRLTWRAAAADLDGPPTSDASPQPPAESTQRDEPLPFDFQYQRFQREIAGTFFEIYATPSADTKILRYFSFNYESDPDFPQEIARIRKHLKNSGARRVLVDVRENAGGAFEPELIGVFTARPFRIMMKSFFYGARIKAHPEAMVLDEGLELWTDDETRILQQDLAANPTATWSKQIPFFCRTAECKEDEAVFQFDGSPEYETVVLAGPSTFSSGDMFVTIMKDNRIARLAGMPSGAGDAPYRWTLDYPTADGTKVGLRLTTAVSYRPNTDGVIIEGNPPTLDHPVYPTRTNSATQLDSVLTAVGWQ
jgi:hypothetical protein